MQCYCGDALYQNLRADSGCTVRCSGDSRSICGGNYRLTVYQLSGPPIDVPSPSPSASSSASTSSTRPSSSAPAPSAVPSAVQTGVSYPPSASGTKWVWAHHMVGNVRLVFHASSPFPQGTS